MLERRVQVYKNKLYYHGPIDDSTVARAAIELDELVGNDRFDDVLLTINSGGGDVPSARFLYEHILDLRNHKPIHTAVKGRAWSSAVLPWQAGSTRSIHELSTVMVHPLNATLPTNLSPEIITSEGAFAQASQYFLEERIAFHTKKPLAEIQTMMRQTTYMTAEEAFKNGFADTLIRVNWDAGRHTMADNGITNGIAALTT